MTRIEAQGILDIWEKNEIGINEAEIAAFKKGVEVGKALADTAKLAQVPKIKSLEGRHSGKIPLTEENEDAE